MAHDPNINSLSAARRRLLVLLQRLNFGRIEELAVRDGEPVFDPPPRLIRKIKIGGENGPRPEAVTADFELRTEVRELFEHLSRLGTGIVRCIEVKNGLPFMAEVEEEVGA